MKLLLDTCVWGGARKDLVKGSNLPLTLELFFNSWLLAVWLGSDRDNNLKLQIN